MYVWKYTFHIKKNPFATSIETKYTLMVCAFEINIFLDLMQLIFFQN